MKVVSRVDKNCKPRIRVCHHCSDKLRGNHHSEIRYEGIDHTFIFHKTCADMVQGKMMDFVSKREEVQNE